MKSILLLPIFDYIKSRKGILKKYIIPATVSIIVIVVTMLFNFGTEQKISEVFAKFVEIQVNIVAILISFSVAIITILVSADNKNIEKIKEMESNEKNYRKINESQLSLFQVLLSNIAYNAMIEILYLFALIGIVLINSTLPIFTLKYILAGCIFCITHILLVLLESISQMYLTFWRNF